MEGELALVPAAGMGPGTLPDDELRRTGAQKTVSSRFDDHVYSNWNW